MTVKELRDRLPWNDEDAEVEVITDENYNLHFGGYSLQSLVIVTINNPEEKAVRVVLMAK